MIFWYSADVLNRQAFLISFFYLVGISGKNKGTEGAKVTAEICNQLHPELVGANMLTIYKNSLLEAVSIYAREIIKNGYVLVFGYSSE